MKVVGKGRTWFSFGGANDTFHPWLFLVLSITFIEIITLLKPLTLLLMLALLTIVTSLITIT